MATQSNGIPEGLLLDSAASCHMIADRKFFNEYYDLENQHVSVGGLNQVPVRGIGTITFRTHLSNGVNDIKFDEVLHIPDLGANLISLGILQRAGAKIKGLDNGICLTWNGHDFLHATLIGSTGTLYQIEHVKPGDHIAFVTQGGTMRLWHRRMGHLGPRTIKAMMDQNLVNGLKIDSPREFDHLCNGCAHGKSHRAPLPDSSPTKYSKMELLVMDLTGPLTIPTWDGNLYVLVVVEASCRFPIGRLLKKKEDVGEAVQDIVAILERQSGIKTKCIQTDSGKEFVNLQMNEFCRRNGIIHETTNPYTPQQNGIAECVIAVLFEMVRCMLHTSNMDLRYWGEAFMYAVHIHSMTLTSGLEGNVPYEAWTGCRPDISHLHIFSSLGWAHVPKEVYHGKLESCAVRVHLLGWWTDETKGYRLEDLENGKLITSRDVQFNEDENPSELASIDIGLPKSTPEDVDNLVDEAIED